MQTVCILGRQPALGLAELESRFGADAIQVVQPGIVLLEADELPDFNHFGSVIRSAKLLTRLETTDWENVVKHLRKNLPGNLKYIPEGKINFGISVYGLKVTPARINATGLEVKKIIRNAGRSARVVPNAEATLNTAQVLHNRLATGSGLELLFIKDGNSILMAQTKWVQDIEAYRRRDQERPMRDSRVGMLPPKLAQILINLSAGSNNSEDLTVLDPFCGTGVLLQEAALMGYGIYGTDLEPRMVEYSQKNLEWLFNTFRLGQSPRPANAGLRMASLESVKEAKIEVADATSHQWSPEFSTIAAETYLGRPFSAQPDPETLKKVIQDVNQILTKFLKNVAHQTPSGFRMCIAVPAWHVSGRVEHLPLLDHLEEISYNRIKFVHAKNEDLVYHREKQIVGRELVVLTRK